MRSKPAVQLKVIFANDTALKVMARESSSSALLPKRCRMAVPGCHTHLRQHVGCRRRHLPHLPPCGHLQAGRQQPRRMAVLYAAVAVLPLAAEAGWPHPLAATRRCLAAAAQRLLPSVRRRSLPLAGLQVELQLSAGCWRSAALLAACWQAMPAMPVARCRPLHLDSLPCWPWASWAVGLPLQHPQQAGALAAVAHRHRSATARCSTSHNQWEFC